MAPLNFPSNPGIGSVHTDVTSGFSYEWNGSLWKSYAAASSSQIKILDDISGSFNGSNTTFALTSNTYAIAANVNPASLIINLGGVVQSPGVDYYISGTNIVFTTAPTSGLSFNGVSLGPAIPVNTILDGTVTPIKLSTGGPYWDTSGNLLITGVTTTSSAVVGSAVTINSSGIRVSGTASQPLQVSGGAYVSGNLGIGTTNPTAKLNIVGNAVSNIVGLGTTNANTTLDFSTGNNFSLTLVGNINILNPSNLVAGQSGFISIIQDSGGSRIVGWGSYWNFPSSVAPTLTTTANGVDVVAYYVRTTTSIAADAIIGIGTL